MFLHTFIFNYVHIWVSLAECVISWSNTIGWKRILKAVLYCSNSTEWNYIDNQPPFVVIKTWKEKWYEKKRPQINFSFIILKWNCHKSISTQSSKSGSPWCTERHDRPPLMISSITLYIISSALYTVLYYSLHSSRSNCYSSDSENGVWNNVVHS